MVYRPPTHGILTPYPLYFDTAIRCILTHDMLPHPTHGMLIPLPIVYQTLSYRIMSLYLLVKQEMISLP